MTCLKEKLLSYIGEYQPVNLAVGHPNVRPEENKRLKSYLGCNTPEFIRNATRELLEDGEIERRRDGHSYLYAVASNPSVRVDTGRKFNGKNCPRCWGNEVYEVDVRHEGSINRMIDEVPQVFSCLKCGETIYK